MSASLPKGYLTAVCIIRKCGLSTGQLLQLLSISLAGVVSSFVAVSFLKSSRR